MSISTQFQEYKDWLTAHPHNTKVVFTDDLGITYVTHKADREVRVAVVNRQGQFECLERHTLQ